MRFIKNDPAPAAAVAPAGAAAAAPAQREQRILTFGDVFGRDAGGLIVLLVLFGGMTLASNEFLTGDNMANLARQVAVFGIIAVGQLLVILTAGIDLSVGSVLGLTGCIAAELLVHGMGIVPAILLALAAGTAIGVFNGVLVAYGKLPPFIVTLGMLGIARGAVLVLTDASTVHPPPWGARRHGGWGGPGADRRQHGATAARLVRHDRQRLAARHPEPAVDLP